MHTIRGHDPVVNNRLLQDIVDDLNQHGLGGTVLSLDQEKAFEVRLHCTIGVIKPFVVQLKIRSSVVVSVLI